jgi:hypothetical protein
MADYDDIELAPGQTDYIARLNTLRQRCEALATEVDHVQLQATIAEVEARINALAVTYAAGLTQNFNASSYRITALGDPVNPQDGATRAWVLSQLTIGGDPSGVPVTSLNVGSMGDGLFLRRVGAVLQGVGAVDLINNQTVAGAKNWTGNATFSAGGGGFSIAAGATDHCYAQFFARTATPGVRSGYMGYSSAGSTTFTVLNEIAGGHLDLRTTGGGRVRANGTRLPTPFLLHFMSST